ncbi:MAG: hypothetical protein R3E53_10065 [Myxococcota bacterium]
MSVFRLRPRRLRPALCEEHDLELAFVGHKHMRSTSGRAFRRRRDGSTWATATPICSMRQHGFEFHWIHELPEPARRA